MTDDVIEIDREEWHAMRDEARANPPTHDDVWITRDGTRLDTPEKVLAFMRDQLERQKGLSHAAPSRAATP